MFIINFLFYLAIIYTVYYSVFILRLNINNPKREKFTKIYFYVIAYIILFSCIKIGIFYVNTY